MQDNSIEIKEQVEMGIIIFWGSLELEFSQQMFIVSNSDGKGTTPPQDIPLMEAEQEK